MIIDRIIGNFREVYGLLHSGRRKDKRLESRVVALERALAALTGSAESGYDVSLAHVGALIPMEITGRVQYEVDTTGSDDLLLNYFTARRIENHPEPLTVASLNRWRIDPDDDIEEYVVVPTPGNTGLFVGCIIWATLSHSTKLWTGGGSPTVAYEGEIYVPVAGEHLGFWARITGAPSEPPPGPTKQRIYPWSQVGCGLNSIDALYSGQVLHSYELPKALHLDSASVDPLISAYRDVDIGQYVFIRYIGGGYSTPSGDQTVEFVFNHTIHPETDEECP